MRTHTRTVSDWSKPLRDAAPAWAAVTEPATRRPTDTSQTARLAPCYRPHRQLVGPADDVWVDGRMQWPVSQHRSVIEPPVRVVEERRSISRSRPFFVRLVLPSGWVPPSGAGVHSAFAALFASPPLGEGGGTAVFRFPPTAAVTNGDCAYRASIYCSQRERPGIRSPPPSPL
jgi:hypothetical protein